MFSNTWKYFFGESCSRPTPNVDLESKPDLNTNLLSNNPITTDEPVIQRKVLFIDILDGESEHKEEIKVEPILEQEVEQQAEPILEQQEIKVEPILEQQAEPILEQEEIKEHHNEAPIVEQQAEPILEQEEIKVEDQQIDLSLLPKTAAECAILNQNLPENWRPFPMSNILQ
jgi:hypothetical protein